MLTSGQSVISVADVVIFSLISDQIPAGTGTHVKILVGKLSLVIFLGRKCC